MGPTVERRDSFDATAERIHEYAGHEANYSMANVLRGARTEEKQQ